MQSRRSARSGPSAPTAAAASPPIAVEEWLRRARALFGDDQAAWRFVCPSCGHVASVADWRDAGAPENTVAFSCVGRWLGADDAKTFRNAGGPCMYAGGGLFGINPIAVVDEQGRIHRVFAFAGDGA